MQYKTVLLKNILVFSLLIALFSCRPYHAQVETKSPDGTLKISVWEEGGKAFYKVSADGKSIINPSTIGFDFRGMPFLDDSLKISNVSKNSHDETWKPVCGFSSEIRNNYNESFITFTESGGMKRSFTLIARAYNDGVAFRYQFPKYNQVDSLLILVENTHFSFPANDTAWWIPSNEFAYESLYRKTPLRQIPDANTPFTIATQSGFYVSLHEAALYDYSEMTLKRTPEDSLSFVSSLWAEPDGVCASVKLPFATPWRSIMIARKVGGLIESHLIQNLNEPCTLKDVSWIKPMKFVGIWWGMHTGRYTWFAGPKHGATTARAKLYIDFAKKHHLGGVLAEGWNKGWETWAPGLVPKQDFCTAYPDFDLKAVVDYAKANQIEFISHHETGGNIPEYEKQIDSAFALCHKLGIHYLKTGYAGTTIPKGYHHHGQYMVRHFQRVVELAAKYHIMLDVHESIKPTGIDRTFPNLMSQEAGRGNEWNATYKASPASHAATLPFGRFLAGPFDYTPGIFHIIHTPDMNKRLYCTLANQLAMYVVFYSPMMMVSDMIENYENKPAFRFIEEVPCVWDETHVVDAVIGDYVSIARRSGDKWFVGSLCNENNYLIKIPLSFLDKGKQYVATIYGDSITTDWEKNPEAVEIGTYQITSTDTIYAALSKAGGHCINIRHNVANESSTYPSIKTYNQSSTAKMNVFKKLKTYGDNHISHLAVKKPVKLLTMFSNTYPASGNNALTEGIRGMLNYSMGNWQGYEGTDMDATIDLLQLTSIHRITAGFLSDPSSWIFLPKQIEFYVSLDGKNFTLLDKQTHTPEKPSDMNTIAIKDFTYAFTAMKVRYVRVKANAIMNCPEWHSGKGNKAWLFSDEIIVE